MSGISDDRPRQYLLRRLPEADVAHFEDCILEEDGCAERLREAEDDLLDDYAAGRLSADEREAVERFLLNSPDGRQRLLFARALEAMPRQSGSRDDLSGPHVDRRAAAGGSSTPGDVSPASLTRKWIAPIGLLLAASVAFVLLYVPASRNAAPPGAPPGDVSGSLPPSVAPTTAERDPDQATPYTVLLLAETQRGPDSTQRVSIPPGTEQLRLQLEVASDAPATGEPPTYRIAVRDLDGQELFASASLAARQVAAFRIVETMVPVRALSTGDRRVFLSRVNRDAVVPVFDWEINLRIGESAP